LTGQASVAAVINLRPPSPRVEEVEAIIGSVYDPQLSALQQKIDEVDQLYAKATDAGRRNDCDAWEDQYLAHLMDGVLQIHAQPTEPSRELALFERALEELRQFVRANPEPRDMHSQEHDRWSEEEGRRMEGLDRVVSAILSGNAPPLDVLAAIASEYVLPAGYPRAAQIADKKAHDGISDWVVKRLVHALLPSRDMSAILKHPATS
jgi:hypothetical protein